MKVFFCAISAIIMARIVRKYAKIPEIPNYWLDFSIQLIHIFTFILIFISVQNTNTSSFFNIIIALYCLIYIVLCIKEFFLDIIYILFTDDKDAE